MCLYYLALFGVSVYLVVESAGHLNDPHLLGPGGQPPVGNAQAGNAQAGNAQAGNAQAGNAQAGNEGFSNPVDDTKTTTILNLVSGVMGVLLAGVAVSAYQWANEEEEL